MAEDHVVLYNDFCNNVNTYRGVEKPYRVFESQVNDLIIEKNVWPGAVSRDLKVNRLLNHAFEVLWTSPDGQEQRVLLELPYSAYGRTGMSAGPYSSLMHQSAVLAVASEVLVFHNDLDVRLPELLAWDPSRNNAVNAPYHLIKSPPGMVTAYNVIESLRNDERELTEFLVRLAKQVGLLFHSILHSNSTTAGKPVIEQDQDGQQCHRIREFFPAPSKSREITQGRAVGKLMSNNFLYLSEQFGQKRKVSQGKVAAIEELSQVYADASNTVQRLLEPSGLLEDVNFVLVGGGPGPMSVLLAEDSDGKYQMGTYSIAGSAILAPAFMACRPPLWLWRPSEQWLSPHIREWSTNVFDAAGQLIVDELDSAVLEDIREPVVEAEPGFQRVKEVFDEAAGPLYRQYAYDPRYRFARRVGWSACEQVYKEYDIRSFYDPDDPNRLNIRAMKCYHEIRKLCEEAKRLFGPSGLS